MYNRVLVWVASPYLRNENVYVIKAEKETIPKQLPVTMIRISKCLICVDYVILPPIRITRILSVILLAGLEWFLLWFRFLFSIELSFQRLVVISVDTESEGIKFAIAKVIDKRGRFRSFHRVDEHSFRSSSYLKVT